MIRTAAVVLLVYLAVAALDKAERRRIASLRCAGCDRPGGPLCNYCCAEAGLRMVWSNDVAEA